MNPDILQSLPSFKKSKVELEEVSGDTLISSEYGKEGLSGCAIMRHKTSPHLCVVQCWHTDDYYQSTSTWGTISTDDARPFVGNLI